MNEYNDNGPLKFKHIKTGNIYYFLGFGLLEKDGEKGESQVMYYSPDSEITWIRPLSEWSMKFERLN